eukprot:1159831-Pelagomonas_calceolata.AAC.8
MERSQKSCDTKSQEHEASGADPKHFSGEIFAHPLDQSPALKTCCLQGDILPQPSPHLLQELECTSDQLMVQVQISQQLQAEARGQGRLLQYKCRDVVENFGIDRRDV